MSKARTLVFEEFRTQVKEKSADELSISLRHMLSSQLSPNFAGAFDLDTIGKLVGATIGSISAGALSYCEDVKTTDEQRIKLKQSLVRMTGAVGSAVSVPVGIIVAIFAEATALGIELLSKKRDFSSTVDDMMVQIKLRIEKVISRLPAEEIPTLKVPQQSMERWMDAAYKVRMD